MLKNIKLLKIGVGLCVFMALFFSYQLPFGKLQTSFKALSLGVGILLMLVIMNFKSEAPRKWWNMALIIVLAATLILYFFETE